MSMNNAQAALIAAATYLAGGDDVSYVYQLARGFKASLDNQDTQNQPGRRPCGHTSTHGSVCTKEEHPASDQHENSLDGVRWLEKPATVQAPAARRKPDVHFTPSPGAKHTTCGLSTAWLDNGATISLQVGNTTCPNCKEELGL